MIFQIKRNNCLKFCFFYKNKNILRFLAAKMQSLVNYGKYRLNHTNLERCHEFLRDYTDIVTNNIYTANDYNYPSLRGLIQKTTL